MMTRVAWTAALMLLVAGVGTANAQDDRHFGLTMGYPTAVGVLWHLTDRIAIRPEVDFSRISTTTESTSTVTIPIDLSDEASARNVRTALSALIYLAPRDELRMYVVPRFAYSSSNTSQSGDSNSNYFVSGSFGAQHRVGSRFSVFGELGIEYSHGTSRLSATPISITSRRNIVATRSAVGVILYF